MRTYPEKIPHCFKSPPFFMAVGRIWELGGIEVSARSWVTPDNFSLLSKNRPVFDGLDVLFATLNIEGIYAQ